MDRAQINCPPKIIVQKHEMVSCNIQEFLWYSHCKKRPVYVRSGRRKTRKFDSKIGFRF